MVEIEHRERLGVAGHDQAALGRRHRREMTVPVAAQQLAEAAVEAADRGNRRVGILHRVDVGVAVAVEIAGDDTLQRRDLREARQRFEAIGAVRLAEEHAAAKFRGGEALGGGQLVLAENFPERGRA